MQMTEVSEGRVDDCQLSCEQVENFDELLQQVSFEAPNCSPLPHHLASKLIF
jgi:hypothetical protein